MDFFFSIVPKVIRIVNFELKTNAFIENYKTLLLFDPDNVELQRVIALLCLGYLFPPVFRKKRDYNSKQKPSKIDIQNAFVSHFTTVTAFKLHVESLKAIESQKQTVERLHPLGFILGDLADPTQLSFVIKILDIELTFERDIWTGMDVLFKMFFGYQAFYPTAAQHVWLFWQQEIYKIKTNNDKKVFTVAYLSFLKEYKMRLTGEDLPDDINLPAASTSPTVRA